MPLTEAEIFDRTKSVTINHAADSDALIAAPGAGLVIVVMGLWLVAGGGANSIQFRSGTVAGGSIPLGAGPIGLAANGGLVIPPFFPMFKLNPNEALSIDLSAATLVGGGLWYYLDHS